MSRLRPVSGQKEQQSIGQPHARDRASYIPELLDLLGASSRLELLNDSAASATLDTDWRFHVSDGHMPGQLLPEIAMPTGPVVFGGDLVPGASWIHLPITMRCDCGAERLIDEKTTMLEDLLARNDHLVFTHDPQVAIGRISRDSKGRFGLSESAEDVVALTE